MDILASRKSKGRCVGLILCGASVFGFQIPALATQSVVLAWTPSISANVVGYKMYYGTASHDYGCFVTVANTNTVTISGLADETTYYFAATACNSGGDESPFSNEIVYLVPTAAATLTVLPRAGNNFIFSVSGVSGYQYIVQSSTNLVDWVSVLTNPAPFTFTNSRAANSDRCFYRTFYLPP